LESKTYAFNATHITIANSVVALWLVGISLPKIIGSCVDRDRC